EKTMKSKNGRRTSKSSRSASHARNNVGRPYMTIERSRDVIVSGLRNLQEETIRMVDRRFERDSEAIRECQNCRNLIDFHSVQQKWLAGVSMAYYQGGMRLGRVVQDIMSEEASELSEAAESTMQEAASQAQHASA